MIFNWKKKSVSHHLSIFTAQVLQLLLHSLQGLQEVIILLRQPLVLLKHRLHLALCLSHPLQLDKERKQREEAQSFKFLPSCIQSRKIQAKTVWKSMLFVNVIICAGAYASL